MASRAASLHGRGGICGAATSRSHDLDRGELGIQSIRYGGGLRALFPEHQASHTLVPVDAQSVAHSHLFRGQEVSQRENHVPLDGPLQVPRAIALDRKSTRLNSSHLVISYAVFCLKKKKNN